MKKYFLNLILVISPLLLFSQKKQVDVMTYEQTQDINYFINIKNNTKLNEYITINGNSVKLGDTLFIGNPTSSSSFSTSYGNAYATQYGAALSSSTRATNRREFEFIQMGRPAGFGSILAASGGQGPTMAGIQYKNEKVRVEEMKVYHKGSKKKPLNVLIILGEINGRAFGINKYMTVQNTEFAIESGELFLLNRKMTRDEALVKLKEAKELYDLDLMSKDEYEKLRTELAPIITSK
tara:strand:+ start:587 stop:1297 length:711 start_codon:yes stop_codon:yes gene_type:complete